MEKVKEERSKFHFKLMKNVIEDWERRQNKKGDEDDEKEKTKE